MALHKIRLGTNDDGSPHWLYQQDDPSKPLVVTGPITGSVTLPDGTTYDVSEAVIEVDPGHDLLVSDAIGARYADEGHPAHDADVPFVHTPSALSHNEDGSQSEAFAAAVHDLAPAGLDSSPQAVIDRMGGV